MPPHDSMKPGGESREMQANDRGGAIPAIAGFASAAYPGMSVCQHGKDHEGMRAWITRSIINEA